MINYFLDTSVAAWLQTLMTSMLSGTDTKLQASFGGVYQAVVEFSNGLVAVGLLVTGVYLIIQFLITSQLEYSSIVKVVIMLAIYLGFSATVDVQNGNSIMAVVSRIMDQFEQTIEKRAAPDKDGKIDAAFAQGQKDGVVKADGILAQTLTEGVDTKVADASTSWFSTNITSILTGLILTFFNMIADCLMVLIGFLIVFISKFACWLLIAFAPFCIAISFVKGFEGSFLGMLKYFIVFKLWGVIVAAIKVAMFAVGFTEQISYSAGVTTVSTLNSPSTGEIVMKLCYCVVLCMTPMFADILVSGSQSGGFFSAAMGKAGGGIASIAAMGGSAQKGMIGNTVGNIGKNMGALGGAVGAAKAVKNAGSVRGIMKGMGKLINKPIKNDTPY